MKITKFDVLGMLGVIAIVSSWALVKWSYVSYDSFFNFAISIFGAIAVATEIYVNRHERMLFWKIAVWVACAALIFVACADYFKF
jgi:hypothetical protein